MSCLKIFNINADTYAENCVHTVKVIKKGNQSILWVKMHNIQDKSYKIDLYFVEHKLAIEVDKKGHKDRDRYEDIEREKTTEKDLGCKLIGINPDKKDFDVYVEIGKIYNHINRSCEKSLIDKISKKNYQN